MKVELVSYSQAGKSYIFKNIDMELQHLVAFCARVSNPDNQNNLKTTDNLLRYLIKHKHWSPFEMVSLCLEIETTRDIARQILRHRSFSFQEFSQRYADPVKELTFELKEARMQDEKNRQNSIISTDEELQEEWEWQQQRVIEASKRAYTWAVNKGIAKEQARSVLPEGLTTSRMYMNGSLRSWIHYIELRSANGTQKEHIDVALACAEVIGKVFDFSLVD